MSQFAICEPSLSGEGGHYLHYSMMVAKAVRAAGYTPIIFGNVTYTGGDRDGIRIVPLFTHDIWGEPTKRRAQVRRPERLVFSKLLENPAVVFATEPEAFKQYQRESPIDEAALVERLAKVYAEKRLPPVQADSRESTRAATARALAIAKGLVTEFDGRRSPRRGGRTVGAKPVTETRRSIEKVLDHLAEGDHILFPSMSFLLTKAAGEVFDRHPAAMTVAWHFLYRRNLVSAGPIDRGAQWAAHSARHAIRYMAGRARNVRYRLYTDTERLTEEYEALIGLPFWTLPIPAVDAVDRTREEPAAPTHGRAARPVVVLYKKSGISIPEGLVYRRIAAGIDADLVLSETMYAPETPDFAARILHTQIPVARPGNATPGSSGDHCWRIHLAPGEGRAARDLANLEAAFTAAAASDVVVTTTTAYQALAAQAASRKSAAAARKAEAAGIALSGTTRIPDPGRMIAVRPDPALSGVVALRLEAAMADGSHRVLDLQYEASAELAFPLPVPRHTTGLTVELRSPDGENGAGTVATNHMAHLRCGIILAPRGQDTAGFLQRCINWLAPIPGCATVNDGHNDDGQDGELLPAAIGAAPITIAYFGDARPEKGYLDLFRLADSLKGSREVRFLAQSNTPENGCTLDILKARLLLQRMGSATVFCEALDEYEYAELMRRSDLIWVLYDRLAYFSRSSGIFAEAITAGRTVLTSAGSWMAGCLDAQAYAYHALQFAKSPVLIDKGLDALLCNGQVEESAWKRHASTAQQHLLMPLNGHPLIPASKIGHVWLTFRMQDSRVPFYVHLVFRDRHLGEIESHVERFVGEEGTEFSVALPIPPDAEDLWANIFPQNASHEITVSDLQMRYVLHAGFVAKTPGGFKISQEQDILPQCQAAVLSYLLHKDEYQKSTAFVSEKFRQYHQADNIASSMARQDDWCEYSDRVFAR